MKFTKTNFKTFNVALLFVNFVLHIIFISKMCIYVLYNTYIILLFFFLRANCSAFSSTPLVTHKSLHFNEHLRYSYAYYIWRIFVLAIEQKYQHHLVSKGSSWFLLTPRYRMCSFKRRGLFVNFKINFKNSFIEVQFIYKSAYIFGVYHWLSFDITKFWQNCHYNQLCEYIHHLQKSLMPLCNSSFLSLPAYPLLKQSMIFVTADSFAYSRIYISVLFLV